jgi:DNA-directed RNA polymerase sigma subunit (sigma70/sigma32)
MNSWKTDLNDPTLQMESEEPTIYSQNEDLNERLFEAFEELDSGTLNIMVKRYGLAGNNPLSQNSLAQQSGVDIETINELEAEALRAIMGYGEFAPNKGRKLVEQ